jgi:tungstate transport system substrate-binding protein
MHAPYYARLAIALVLFTVVGCYKGDPEPVVSLGGGSSSMGAKASTTATSSGTAATTPTTITLQTTTSPRDSGLLGYLLPKFREQTGIDVKVIAVGSGAALENARRGDGDVVVAHSPEAELEFMDDGFGVSRRPLMENDFLVVGPAADPAKVKGMTSAADSFRTIAEAKTAYVSRADESGTHVKEKAIWKAAEVVPTGDWYIKAGVGMADALRMADEKQAYLLTDRGTYLAQKEKLKLVPLVEGDPLLLNKYSVIVVASKRHPALHEAEATKFADWLTSPEGKRLINEFGKEKYGESLFRAAK